MEYNFFKKLEELENKIDEIKKSLVKKETYLNPFEGCIGCAFEPLEEWELPCCKCSRCCTDYYRRRENESEI